MAEIQELEVAPKPSEIDVQVASIFNRKVEKYEKGTVIRMYQEKFHDLCQQLPHEEQNRITVKLQQIGILVRGTVGEYGARFSDFIRNIVSWPMIMADSTFPKDKYYQMALARAKAWTGYASDTTKTATRERESFKDHFLPSVIAGATGGAVIGALYGGPIGVVAGLKTGSEIGLAIASSTVAGGGLGAFAGGLRSLVYKIQDRIFGHPARSYNMDASFIKFGASMGAISGGAQA
jgi:hypothetical protein